MPWGQIKIVNGNQFIPHTVMQGNTPFVSEVQLINVGGDADEAQQELTRLRSKYVGRPYSLWRSTPVTTAVSMKALAESSTKAATALRELAAVLENVSTNGLADD